MRFAILWVSVFAVLVFTATVEAGKFNKKLNIGDAAPAWEKLPGTDGKPHALDDYDAKFLVLIFTCNKCPIATAYEERLNRLANEERFKSVKLIAINCGRGKAESVEKMRQRLTSSGLKYEYLKDEDLKTAKMYGARTTPTVFVLNAERKIVYMGAVDDSWEAEAAVEHAYLQDAMTAVIADKPPEVQETLATGCGIPFGNDEEE